FGFVSAASLEAVEDALRFAHVAIEARVVAEERDVERRIAVALIADLDVVAFHLYSPLTRKAAVQQPLVRTEVQRRPQAQRQVRRTGNELVDDVRRVLEVRHQHPLLDSDSSLRESPDRKGGVLRELFEKSFFGEPNLSLDALLIAAQSPAQSVRILNPLLEVIEHHRARERDRERGDEQTVKPACTRAADRSRRVATQGVGDEPFACEERGLVVAAPPSALRGLGFVPSP